MWENRAIAKWCRRHRADVCGPLYTEGEVKGALAPEPPAAAGVPAEPVVDAEVIPSIRPVLDGAGEQADEPKAKTEPPKVQEQPVVTKPAGEFDADAARVDLVARFRAAKMTKASVNEMPKECGTTLAALTPATYAAVLDCLEQLTHPAEEDKNGPELELG